MIDISLAVPITNSLTFVFTMMMGKLLGEKITSSKHIQNIHLLFYCTFDHDRGVSWYAICCFRRNLLCIKQDTYPGRE